jgi:hypothetical protein
MSSTHSVCPQAANAAPVPAHSGPGRLVLVCTPRSGNNWLRCLLGSLYDMPTRSVHTPDEVDWDRLPDDWLFAVHWRPTAPFLERLRRHGFRVIVLARHPLDALISVLQFCWRSPSTERWLEGEGGDERVLWGAMPRSEAFLGYAAGPRAEALLSVSRQWWGVPGVVPVRYEDLVADGPGTVARLAQTLGGRPQRSVEEALAATTMPALRIASGRPYHFWQGKPGLWKTLLPAAEVEVLAAALAPTLGEFGYVCDPDANLTPAQADANWIGLVGKDLVDDLRAREALRGELAEARARLAQCDHADAELAWRRDVAERLTAELEWRREVQRQQADELEWRRGVESHQAAELERLRESRGHLERSLAAVQGEREALGEELARLRRLAGGLGPVALVLARRLQRLAMRFPRASAAGRRLLRLARSAPEAPPAVTSSRQPRSEAS